MRWSGKKSVGPIGVDIGSRFIKAVQVAGRGNKAKVIAASVVPRAKVGAALEREEIASLGEVLFRQGFQGHRVVLAAPGESLIVGALSLPPRQSGAPVDEIARMELARMHKQDPWGFELVHWELPAAPSTGAGVGGGSKAGSCAVMAAACPHTDSNVLVDLFDAASLEVVGIDVPWLALARACAPLSHGDKATASSGATMTAILDLGWTSARVIVLRQDVIVFERVLTDGGQKKLSAKLRDKLQLDEASADLILREVGCAVGTQQTSDESGEQKEVDAAQNSSDEQDHKRASDFQNSSVEDGFKEPRRIISAHFADVMEELKVSLNYALAQYRSESIDQLILAGGGAVPGLAQQWSEAMQINVVTAELGALSPGDTNLGRFATSPMLAAAMGLGRYEV